MSPQEEREAFSVHEPAKRGLFERVLSGERQQDARPVPKSSVVTFSEEERSSASSIAQVERRAPRKRSGIRERVFAFVVMAVLAALAFYTTKENDAVASIMASHSFIQPLNLQSG